MSESQTFQPESSEVDTHLTIMQGVINRMADNSRWCKVWCVTLVSAALVLAARTDNPHHTLVALAPIVLFLVLDAYYLGLERSYRWSYNRFVKHLHQGKLQREQLFRVTKLGSDACHLLISFGSPSIWLFYVFIVATALTAWLLLWFMASPTCPGAR